MIPAIVVPRYMCTDFSNAAYSYDLWPVVSPHTESYYRNVASKKQTFASTRSILSGSSERATPHSAAKSTANPTLSGDRTGLRRSSLRKREFLLFGLETFGKFSRRF